MSFKTPKSTDDSLGVSFRHGINCSYRQHVDYLKAIGDCFTVKHDGDVGRVGMEPEMDAEGYHRPSAIVTAYALRI